MARHGENIRKRKDGRWEGRYSKGKVNGKTVQGSVFASSYREVKEKLIRAKAEVSGQKISSGRKVFHITETFRKVAEEWFASTSALKESTRARYRSILDVHLIPTFGEKCIESISRADIVAYSNKLLSTGGRQGKGLSPKSVVCILSVLKIVLAYAKQEKEANIVDLGSISVRQEQKTLRVFSAGEYKTISDSLVSTIQPDRLGILLSLYTGLRIGEICALKWEDISFSEKVIYVTKTMQRVQLSSIEDTKTQVIVTPPKSSCSIRAIPIPDELFRILEQLRQPDDCYLLTGSPVLFMEPRTLENHFNKLMKEFGIEGATMHTCRHSFATRCVELGFDIKTLSEILGHASVSITMNRYVHPSMELKQKNMDKLSRLLAGQSKSAASRRHR